MEIEGPTEENFDTGAGENPAKVARGEQDKAEHTIRLEGEKRLDDFNAELSGTASGRMERHGVGPKGEAAIAEKARRSRTGDSFHMAAVAEAYNQQITFSLGGRDVSMSLGDMRDVASDRYNHYLTGVRLTEPCEL